MPESNYITKTAMFAGGCFWCVEADFEKLRGIVRVISGYSGGKTENPNYENYAKGGHREVVEVAYDPERTTYRSLVEHMVFYGDPMDASGSFHDRGKQYSPAIYYENEEEKNVAEEVLARINAKGVYERPLAIAVLPKTKFWPAEEYHQGYFRKNPIRYKIFREMSGRDEFIARYKNKAAGKGLNLSFDDYQKPSDEILRERLSPLQYKVTQKEGTERPFENEYHDNKADGIYADRISGEPLFSSRDKYDSGTGWPSFTKPIKDEYVVLNKISPSLTEVRSRRADSHLGHVFDDGPKDKGGKRYCMNSAALLFVPTDKMQERGYGRYLCLF